MYPIRNILIISALSVAASIGISKAQPSWKELAPLPECRFLQSVVFVNGQFVGVGGKHPPSDYHPCDQFKTLSEAVIMTSSDGASWALQTSDAKEQLYEIVFGNGLFVAIGKNGTIITSDDGKNWKTRKLDLPELQSVAFGNGGFIAVGDSGTILKSVNGIAWSKVGNRPKTYHNEPNLLCSVRFGGNRFCILGTNEILSSSNGSVWVNSWKKEYQKKTGLDLLNLRSIAYGNKQFVIVEGLGKIIRSSDGVAWMDPIKITNSMLADVKFVENTFIVTSEAPDSIFTSTDGKNWKTKILEIKNINKHFWEIAEGNGQLLFLNPENQMYMISSEFLK